MSSMPLNTIRTTQILSLPWSPSVNRYWRKWQNRMVISTEGRTDRKLVGQMLGSDGIRKPLPGGRIALAMVTFPPDRQCQDLDNTLKRTQDSLAHAGLDEDDTAIIQNSGLCGVCAWHVMKSLLKLLEYTSIPKQPKTVRREMRSTDTISIAAMVDREFRA